MTGPRVGIDYAGAYWAARRWRFWIDSPGDLSDVVEASCRTLISFCSCRPEQAASARVTQDMPSEFGGRKCCLPAAIFSKESS